jgi:hypothetical protein
VIESKVMSVVGEVNGVIAGIEARERARMMAKAQGAMAAKMKAAMEAKAKAAAIAQRTAASAGGQVPCDPNNRTTSTADAPSSSDANKCQ